MNQLAMDLFVDGEWMLSCIILEILAESGFLNLIAEVTQASAAS
jgi:hypothetical protein